MALLQAMFNISSSVGEFLDCCSLPLFSVSQGKEFKYIHLCSCKVTIHSSVTMRNKHRNLSCSLPELYWCISFFTFQQLSTAGINGKEKTKNFKEEWGLIISSWILRVLDGFHSYSCILQYLKSQKCSWGSVIPTSYHRMIWL